MLLIQTSATAASGGFHDGQRLILPAKTPYDGNYTKISWQTDSAEGTGVPVAAGDYVFLPQKDTLYRLAESDGAHTGSVTLPENASENCSGAVVGSTLIQPTESGIAVIDVNSLELLQSRSFEGSIDSDCAVIDGLVYFSVRSDDSSAFMCVDIEHGLSTVWEYRCESAVSSPSLLGEYILFSAGDKLISHHYLEDRYSEIDIGTVTAGAPFADKYAVYLSGADGNAYKLRLNSDGTMEDGTLTSCPTGADPSSPLVWNGRLYVAADNGFHIIDSLSMEPAAVFEGIKRGCDPVLCYGNGTRIYTVAGYEERQALYCVLDVDSLDEPQYTALSGLDNFTGGKIAVSQNGTMYFRDGDGRLFALAVKEYNYFLIVLRLVLLTLLIIAVFFWLYQVRKRRREKMPKF